MAHDWPEWLHVAEADAHRLARIESILSLKPVLAQSMGLSGLIVPSLDVRELVRDYTWRGTTAGPFSAGSEEYEDLYQVPATERHYVYSWNVLRHSGDNQFNVMGIVSPEGDYTDLTTVDTTRLVYLSSGSGVSASVQLLSTPLPLEPLTRWWLKMDGVGVSTTEWRTRFYVGVEKVR